MKLIKLSEDVLVNPDFISSVESRMVEGVKVIVVVCDGKEYTSLVPPAELLKELVASKSLTLSPKIFQFWAG